MKKLIALILLSVTVTGCSDPDLTTMAKALRDTSQAVSVLQTTTIEANKSGLLSDDTTRSVLTLTIKVNKAGLEADNITRNLSKLAPADRGNLLKIFDPLIASLAETDSVVSLIPNTKVRSDIQVALVLIRTSLSTAQLALVSR